MTLFKILSVSLLITLYGSVTASPIAMKNNQTLLQAKEFGTILSASVELAKSLFEELNSEERLAKGLIQIENYSRWRLEHCTFVVLEGEAADTPLNVPSGTTEAFFVHQSAYFKPNEGMFYFQVDGVTHGEGNFCMVYWRIDNRRRPTFRPNMLGVGCQEDLYAMKIVADEIEDLGKDAEEGVRDFLEYQYARKEIQKIQYCVTDFCIQGIMPNSNQVYHTLNISFRWKT